MRFPSILFAADDPVHVVGTQPDFFSDLHLDQIVGSITSGLDEFDLKPFFFTPLRAIASIRYRQDIMQELEEPHLREAIDAFCKGMRLMREHIVDFQRPVYRYQKQRYFLEAVNTYCDAVDGLTRALSGATAVARGWRSLRDYLGAYTAGNNYLQLAGETKRLWSAMARIAYTLEIAGSRVTVSRYNGESDYGAEVRHTFNKFRQGDSSHYAFPNFTGPFLSQVEEEILDRVARLYPEIFASLGEYVERHQNYLDDVIREFDREVHFYTACLSYMGMFKVAGWSCCYPVISTDASEYSAVDMFDAALAARFIKNKNQKLVTNDFKLEAKERVLVVSGANQGGKTTFARAFGQLHYLARLGCPVPARAAHIFPVDRMFTHFEREEDLQNLAGKLELDLERIHGILQNATGESLLVMNEPFSSTTLADALFISRQILAAIIDRGMLCLMVTFFDELAAERGVVSVVAGVEEANQAARTFKLIRRPADGRAYAATLARRYRLTQADLKARLSS